MKSKFGNSQSIFCPKTKQFSHIVICANKCFDRCIDFDRSFDIQILENYIEIHPDYEIKGVIMPVNKTETKTQTPSKSSEKIYWVVTDTNQYVEVPESEIINNPAGYFGKPMFEKPKDQYEVVVTIKKKTK